MSRQRDILVKFLDLRAGEAGPLVALILLSFSKGAAAVLFDTAANTNFVKNYGSSSLPLVYLAAAGISLLVGAVYSSFASRIETRRMLLGTLSAAVVSILLMYVGFQCYSVRWLPLLAMVWKEALFILSNIVLWATAGYLFDLRQGKRLFGLVAAGGISASIIGGLVIPELVRTLGLSQLFLLAAIAMAGTIGCLGYITHHYAKSFSSAPEPGSRPAHRRSNVHQPWWHLFRNRYLGLFLSLSILSNFGFFFADYVYFNRVGSVYQQEAELAAFFGRFSAVLGGVQLVTSLFLAGPIITRFGLGLALMALPIVNGLGMSAAAIIHGFGMNTAFFWLIIAIKLCDEALRASLLAPAFRILYQPLPAHERLAFQAKTESIIEPLGVGLVGGVLVLLTTVWHVSLTNLCLILVAILAIWIAVAELLRHEYTRMLTRAMSRPRLGGSAVTLEDAAASAIFLQGTHSVNPGEVIYCLNILEETGHSEWSVKLEEALTHTDSQVREYCLARIEEKTLKSFKDLVRLRWQIDSSPPVRRLALQTYCALGEEEVVEEVSDLLVHPDEAWRSGSIMGLLRYGGIEGVLLAGSHLQHMIQSNEEKERKQAAEILGKMGMPNFYRPLIKLLEDPSDEVRRAALRAAGKLKNPKLIPRILNNLAKRCLRPSAIAALKQCGPAIIPILKVSMETVVSLEIRRSLVQVLGQIGGPEAINILLRQLANADKSLRGQVLEALNTLEYQVTPEVQPTFRSLISAITIRASRNLLTQAEFTRGNCWPLLVESLASELQEDRRQLLKLLACFPGAHPLRLLSKDLHSHSRAQRARAIELLENLVPPDLKSVVSLFLDDLTLEQQADRVAEYFPVLPLTLEQQLVALADSPPEHILRWTKTCAIYEIGRNHIQVGRAVVTQSLQSEEPILRQTAEWTAWQFRG